MGLSPRRRRSGSDDESVARSARHADLGVLDRDAGHRRTPPFDRWHGEVSPAPRRRPADRIGLHSGHAGDDVLRLNAGRLRDGVCVLPDRQDGTGPESDRRRNRRPGPRAGAGARSARQAFQHRPHGHGRAAAQLRRDDEGAENPGGRSRPGAAAAPRHAVNRGAPAGARAAGARAADAQSRRLAARPDRRTARSTGAAQQESTASPRLSRPANDSRSGSGAGLRSST